mgnify:CR=1 FL=1
MKIFGCRIAAVAVSQWLVCSILSLLYYIVSVQYGNNYLDVYQFQQSRSLTNHFCFSYVCDCDHNTLHPYGENMIIQSAEHRPNPSVLLWYAFHLTYGRTLAKAWSQSTLKLFTLFLKNVMEGINNQSFQVLSKLKLSP